MTLLLKCLSLTEMEESKDHKNGLIGMNSSYVMGFEALWNRGGRFNRLYQSKRKGLITGSTRFGDKLTVN